VFSELLGFGLCPSSGILETREHNVFSELLGFGTCPSSGILKTSQNALESKKILVSITLSGPRFEPRTS
jgi:hypothetical protein